MVAMIVIYGSRQTVVFGAGTTTHGTGVYHKQESLVAKDGQGFAMS